VSRLSDALHAAAADGPGEPEIDLDLVRDRVGARRRRRTRARIAGSAAGVLALVAGLAVAVSAAGGEPAGQVSAQAPEISEPEEPTSSSIPDPTSTVPDPTTSTTEPEPTTTSTEPEASTTVPPTIPLPPTTTAPPGPVEMTWTYAGLEQYRIGQPQCPELTHWLDAEATGADGSAWVMREDYCGEHHGSSWEGEGTFSLASPAGSLSGAMTSTAPMPTTGVPYSWTIESGTGTLAGATGDCTVTIVMTDAVFGSAHHEGTITCQVERSVPESV
jgi:hypothetical protein